MGTQVDLDPDVEALLRRQARDRNVDLDRVLNEAIRAGFSLQPRALQPRALQPRALQPRTARPRFAQPTYHLGSDRLDLTKALALAAELEVQEIARKLENPEER